MNETVSIPYLMCIETEDLLLLATSVQFFFNFLNTNCKYIYVLKNESVKNKIVQCQRKKREGVIHVKFIFNARPKNCQDNNVCSRGHLNIDVYKKDIDNKYLSHIKTINISLNYILSAVKEVSAFLAKGRTRH